MIKKLSNKDIGKVIGELAEKVRDEMNFELMQAKAEVMFAENDLYQSLNKEQIELFNDYIEKKNVYYDIAKQMYVKKI